MTVACVLQVVSVRQAAKSAKIHVNRHSPMCKAAGLGYRELRAESRHSDSTAGRSGAAGSAPDVRHRRHGISGISHLFAVKKLGIGISLD